MTATAQREVSRKRARDDEAQPLLASIHPSNKLRTATTTTTAITTKGFQQASREQVYPWPRYNNQYTESTSIKSQLTSITGATKMMTSYGTLTMKKEYRSIDVSSESVRSNQSETESDSEGSNCHDSSGRNSTSSSSSGGVLQSILRIRSEGFICTSSRKKQGSVEFAIDIDDDNEDEVTGKKRAYSCGTSRCYPRRLTLEEKVSLYRVRPDLQITPAPFLLQELDEMKRRRQRKLMFSVLGGSLIFLMMIVFYYLLSQM